MAQVKVKIERRKAQRFSLSRRVTYEVSAQPSSQVSQAASGIDAQVLNVSDGGICLLTKEVLKIAQIIKIELPLPMVRTTTPGIAEVRWVSFDPVKGDQQAGLRFLL